jgi:hypothetical protein
MVASRKDENPASKRKPATTVQGRENQMIALATDVAERQMLSGTASSQVITHYLKLGTETTRLERLKLEQDVELSRARVEAIASAGRIEELYGKAMDAFKGYQPSSDDDIVN